MVSEAKYKAKQGKGLKILSLAQVKAGNRSKTYKMKSDKLYILRIGKKKLLKIYNNTMNSITL